MIAWFMEHAWLVSAGSMVASVAGLAAGTVILVRMPADYFARERGWSAFARGQHPVLRVGLRVGKNLLGMVVLVLGLVMALPLVPGPGVLFLLLGVSLLDFPGKKKVERYLIGRPMVLRRVNALRRRWGQAGLVVSDESAKSR